MTTVHTGASFHHTRRASQAFVRVILVLERPWAPRYALQSTSPPDPQNTKFGADDGDPGSEGEYTGTDEVIVKRKEVKDEANKGYVK